YENQGRIIVKELNSIAGGETININKAEAIHEFKYAALDYEGDPLPLQGGRHFELLVKQKNRGYTSFTFRNDDEPSLSSTRTIYLTNISDRYILNYSGFVLPEDNFKNQYYYHPIHLSEGLTKDSILTT